MNKRWLILLTFVLLAGFSFGCGKEVPQVSEDTTAPVVTLSNPTGDTVTNNNQLEVSGSVDDPSISSVTFILNGWQMSVPVTNGGFSRVITLWEGLNTLQVIAIDAAGNEGKSALITITLDTIPPSIFINSPTEGACINSTTVVIKGTSSDTGSGVAAVLINGVTAAGTKNWTVTFSDESGVHTYEAVALDKAGNQTTAPETVEVTVDIMVDSIYISEPAAGSTNNTSIVVVRGMASDSSGIVKIMVSLDGEPWVEADPSSLPSWTITFTGIIEGSHSLKARALDGCGSGNTAESAEVNFLVDYDWSYPPWIGIEATSPAVGISYVTVTLEDSCGLGLPGEAAYITVSSDRNGIVTEEIISIDDFEGCSTFTDCDLVQVTGTNEFITDTMIGPGPATNYVCLRQNGGIWKLIDTSGYRNIQITYQVTTINLNTGNFGLEISTDGGSNWTLVTNSTLTGNTFWALETFNLSSLDLAVENNPQFAIRFAQDAPGIAEYSAVDNIVITGDPVEDVITFISDNGDGTYNYELRSCELSGPPDNIGPATICACWDNPTIPPFEPWKTYPCAEVYFVAPSIRITSPSDGATLRSADDSSAIPGFQYTVTATTDAPEGSTVTLTVDGLTPLEDQVDETGMVIFYDTDFPEGSGITLEVEVIVCDDVGSDVRMVTVDLSP